MQTAYLPITGTFIDEVSHNVASFNWGEKEWDLDFAAMRQCGIDTAVIIRCGSARWTMYPSAVLEKAVNAWRPPMDLLDLFLRLGDKYGIKIWVGTYHSNHDWLSAAYDVAAETDLMKSVCDEIWNLYGSRHPSFGGWYLSQEIAGRCSFNVVKCFQIVGKHCHELSGKKTFISPGIQGCNTGISRQPSAAIRRRLAVRPQEHEAEWDWIMGEIAGAVDTICFQNAHVDIEQMPEFMEINHRLALKHGLQSWCNLESFDIILQPHPPIRIQEFLIKLAAAKKTGFGKALTFEFSHFMSPNSEFGSARNLYRQYCHYLEINA